MPITRHIAAATGTPATPKPTQSRLPRPLAEFHRRHPDVAVELQTAPSRDLIARLQAGALDAAIVGDEVDGERFVPDIGDCTGCLTVNILTTMVINIVMNFRIGY